MENGQFGASPGDIGQPLPGGLKNEYTSIPDISIADYAKNNTVLPRDITTGNMRGTQTILGSAKSKVVIGNIPDTNSDFGVAFYDSTGVMRSLTGMYPDGSVKSKLSQAGYSVDTATNDQLVWSSDFNVFKIVSSGTTTIAANGSSNASASVAHSLPYLPAVIGYIYDGTSYYPLPNFQVTTTGAPARTITGLVNVTVDTTNVTFQAQGLGVPPATFSTDIVVKYYLLRETVN